MKLPDLTKPIIPPEEEVPMSQRSRRAFLLSLMVPFTLSAAAACQKAPESQKIADKFIEYYYVQISVKDAVPLTSGLAKEKLQGQLQLMADAGPPDTGADKPRVDFSLVSKKNEDADTATYVYQVVAHVQDVGKRLVYVKLRKENGQWRVTTFTEDDSPPTS